MHKVHSPSTMAALVYKAKEDGIADVWIRANETTVPATDESPQSYEADEVFFQVHAGVVPETEIAADLDFWFEALAGQEDGITADHLGIENFRAAKLTEVSQICESTICAGVDVTLGDDTQHFSLAVTDQLNLFGKQSQLAAGAEQLEYHQDGQPCKFYTAAEMTQIITAAMSHVSYHTTYCNSMFAWIKACSKASEISEIAYGAEIPEAYRSEVLVQYLTQEAETA